MSINAEGCFTLNDLPGRPGTTLAGVFDTSADIPHVLSKYPAATAAGPMGAINIWKIRASTELRGELLMVGKTVESKLFDSNSQMLRWARARLKRIR